jgi:hypothetical protein
MAQWCKWHDEQLDAALASPHGAIVERIVDLLHDLTP